MITTWVGRFVKRARIVARLTNPEDTAPSELGKFLLTRFAGDQEVANAQRIRYQSRSGGSWGSWSSHLSGQIERLEGWIRNEGPSSPLGAWASKVLDSLKEERKAAAQAEAEVRR